MRTRDQGPRTVRPFIGERRLSLLTSVIAVAGTVVAIAGVGYAINGATQARATVSVPVAVTGGVEGDLSWVVEPLGHRGLDPERLEVETRLNAVIDQQVEDGIDVWLTPVDGVMVLKVWGSTVPEQLLSRGDSMVMGLTTAVGTVLLVQVLLRISDGVPFHPGQARRFAGLAGLVLVEGVVGPLLPRLGAQLVLERLGVTPGQGSPSPVPIVPSLDPVLLCGLLLVLAEVFRRGHATTREVEGLV